MRLANVLTLLGLLGAMPAVTTAATPAGCDATGASAAAAVDCTPGIEGARPLAPAAAPAGLPEGARAEVAELRVMMRYFLGIGMHDRSRAKRDAIAAIYAEYGIPLPDEYRAE